MSLQVWLPLTKDLRQQGLSNATVSIMRGNETWDNNGKLGKCFYANGVNTLQINNIIPQLYNTNGYSLCAWFYIESQNTVHNGSGIVSGGNWNNQVLNLSVSDWSSDHYTRLRVSGTNWNHTYTYNFYKNIWYHAVVCSDGNKTYAYINGQLIGDTVAGFLPSSIEGNNIAIGGATYYNGMQFFGKINDVRIYDHCLSPMEVKELSKGLILHYPLNRNGWGQENLYHYSKDFSNWTFYSGTTTVVDSGETVISYPNTADTWPGAIANKTILYSKIRNKTITVSADLKADSGISCGFDPCLLLTASETSISRLKYKDNTYNFTGTGEWIHWSATYNITDALFSSGSGSPDYTNCYFSITFYRRITPTGSFKLKNPKVEVGSVATPWCPNSSDELATTMGLNDSTEYDISGYCNNATNFTASEWSSDTPKYSVSTIFDETVLANVPNIYDSTSRHKQLTFAAWIKRTSDDANIHLYWASPAINIGLQSYQGVNNYHKIQWSHATEESVGSGRNWINTVIPLNVWTYDVWVFDSGVWKHYINGELTGTRNDSSVGEYIYGSINSTLGDDWQGALSDIRIYATALSASDVKSLYQNCATIDPDGTIRGQIRI